MPVGTEQPKPAPTVPLRVRSAFRTQALFEMMIGLLLMGNPILGPSFPVNAYIVSVLGILLLVVAVVCGGAGLGKGPLAFRSRAVGATNAVCAASLGLWSIFGTLGTAAGGLVLALAFSTLGLAALQLRADRVPSALNLRQPSTQAQRRAAIFSNESDSD